MASRLRVLITVAGVVALGGVAQSIPGALDRSELFAIRSVRLEGARWLTQGEVEGLLDIAPGTPLWEDRDPWLERVRAHPLIRGAEIRRRLPGTLVVQVQEREPVALLPTPALEPVDAMGETLPLDPSLHRLDLPLLGADFAGSRPARPLTPEALAALATELARLSEVEPDLVAQVSVAAIAESGDVTARLTQPAIELLFRAPLAHSRLQEGWRALEDAERRRPETPVLAVDLRFADQVLIRFGQGS